MPHLAAVSIYVLVEEDTLVMPQVVCKFIKPSELPKTGNYYVISKDRCQQHRDTVAASGFVSASIDDIRSLAPSSTAKATSNLPPIPSDIIYKAWQFFREVYRKHRSEAEVMLMYNAVTQAYDLWCPNQEVSGGKVNYTLDKAFLEKQNKAEGWKNVGTIHSHCNFGAFHSGTDVDDEENRDGLHITIGHVDQDLFSMVASLVINGVREQIDCHEVIDGLSGGNLGGRTRGSRTVKDGYDRFYGIPNPPHAEFIAEIKEWLERAKQWKFIPNAVTRIKSFGQKSTGQHWLDKNNNNFWSKW